MRIGIDIDDTISNTNDLLIEAALEFDRTNFEGKGFKDKSNFKFTDMFYWTEEMKNQFCTMMYEKIIPEVPLKPHAKEVINRLKDEGNEIYIITARSFDDYSDPVKISKMWLERNGIRYNKLFAGIKNKGIICKENNVDIFIDDLPSNCRSVELYGIKTLLFDSDFNKDVIDFKRVERWEEVYNIIKSEVK